MLIFFLEAAFLFCFKVANANGDLIINEIMYDLPGVDEKHEWLEMYDAGDQEIDLTGWKINDGDDATNHALNPPPKNNSRGSLILTPGSYLLLAGDAKTVAGDLPDFNGTVIDTAIRLPNSSGTIKILDEKGQEIYTTFYSKDLGGAGDGKSLEWDGVKFVPSTASGGTPGKINSVLAQDPPLPQAATLLPTAVNAGTTNLATNQNKADQKESEPPLASSTPIESLTQKVITPQQNNKTDLKNDSDQIIISSDKTFFWLLGIIVLSLITALGLAYFKKQKAKRPDDTKDNNFF